jgi:MFS family permease
MTENEFSWAVSMMPLGGALSGVISGIIRNRFGTKATMLVFAIPNLLGWLALIFAWNPLMVSALFLAVYKLLL